MLGSFCGGTTSRASSLLHRSEKELLPGIAKVSGTLERLNNHLDEDLAEELGEE
jgi:hypothetical protein